MKAAFAGSFAARLVEPVRRRLTIPCEIVSGDGAGILAGSTVPATAPFYELNNVVMTPHVSGWMEGMLETGGGAIAENIVGAMRSEEPPNAIAAAH